MFKIENNGCLLQETQMATSNIKTILITGSNIGIGKEIARQTALIPGTTRIYLACRDTAKADEAKTDLQTTTGKSIFETLKLDCSSVSSVKEAVANLPEPIDALFMNAGGLGGSTPERLTTEGVTEMFASNILGHVVLLEELIKQHKIRGLAVLTGSEAARGVKKLGLKKPEFPEASVEVFASVCNGTYFKDGKFDRAYSYGQVKYLGALWMSDLARKHPELRLITVSPGATRGTNVSKDLPAVLRFINDYIAMPILLRLFGLSHGLETGARRLVDGAYDSWLENGHFYASAENTLSGPLVDQSTICSDFGDPVYQEKANEAIHRFLT